MGRHSPIGVAVTAFILVAVGGTANPVRAQNLNDLLRIFGGDRQRGPTQAQAEWHRLPHAEMSCIDHRLRSKGSSIEALIRGGVKRSAAQLVELRSGCREFAHRPQTGSAPALARDATGSPRTAIAASNPTGPKDTNVTSSAEPSKDSDMASTEEPPKDVEVAFSGEPSKNSDVTSSVESSKETDVALLAEPPKDSGMVSKEEPPKESDVAFSEPTTDSAVTPPAVESPKESAVTQPGESPKDTRVTLLSKQSVGQAAEELVQQVNLEPKSSVPERGIKDSQSAALLFAIAVMAALFAIVMHLFVKWRNAIRSAS
jgi:hypothetical protein